MTSHKITACGLNCETCEIRLAPLDSEAAKTILKWFRSQGWLAEDEGMAEMIARKMYCTGCLGSRETYWSADCWILICCVDQHGLENCSQCPGFPYGRLIEWSEWDKRYQEGLARLKQVKAKIK